MISTVHGLNEGSRGVCTSVTIDWRRRVSRSGPGMYHHCYHTSCKRGGKGAVSGSRRLRRPLSTPTDHPHGAEQRLELDTALQVLTVRLSNVPLFEHLVGASRTLLFSSYISQRRFSRLTA